MHEDKIKYKRGEWKKLIKCVVEVEALWLNECWDVIDKLIELKSRKKKLRLTKHLGVL